MNAHGPIWGSAPAEHRVPQRPVRCATLVDMFILISTIVVRPATALQRLGSSEGLLGGALGRLPAPAAHG